MPEPECKKAERPIPFFDYAGSARSQERELLEAVRDVMSRGAFILQKDVRDFETAFAKYLGIKHCVGLANCTDALALALRAAGIGPGDEVIFPSHTFVATASSIHFVGATPVPVECGRDHLMDPASARAAVTSRTRAIMPVQLNGRVCDMDTLQKIAKDHNLIVIEDSAQAFGAKYKGRFGGTFGLAGAFSFYPAKTLGCLGDGGALVTDDDEMARKVRLMRDHGRDEKGAYGLWGVNSRLDNLQAAILNVRLKTYDQAVQRRRFLAGLYDKNLNGISQLVLPPAPGSDPDRFDIFQNYEIEAENRDGLKTFLEQNGIRTLLQWGGIAVHQMKPLGFTQHLPATDRVMARSMLLPMNTTLSDVDVLTICDTIRQFYKYREPS